MRPGQTPVSDDPALEAALVGSPAFPAETGADLVDDLHTAFGNHHARAVHAKGIILEGEFEPDASARTLTHAVLFEGAAPVTVRFSNFTGLPEIPDNDPNANPRGMAIRFGARTAPVLDVVTHNFDGFPTRTADEFGALLRAIGHSGPPASTPTPLDAFLAAHPRAKAFLTHQHPAPISYATTAYYGVNAVAFTDSRGQVLPVRYQFIPKAGEQYYGADDRPTTEYLKAEIGERLADSPVVFEWFAQIGEPDDLVDDPSIAWPTSRRRVRLGVVTINHLSANTVEDDRSLSFLPGHMPKGMAAADPMLAARTQAYPVSMRQRQ